MHAFRRLLGSVGQFRGRMVLASLYSVLNKLFDLAPPALIGAAVDVVVQREQSLLSFTGITDPAAQLGLLAAITVVVWVGESVFEYLFELYWRNLAQDVQHSLRNAAYQHVQEQELAYFEDQSTGNLISVLNEDINQLERFLNTGASELIQVATTVLVIGTVFVVAAPQIGWMAMVPIPFIVTGSFFYQRLLTQRYAAVRAEAGELAAQFGNNLQGMATIKAFGTQDYEAQRILRLSNNYRRANERTIRLSSAFVPLIRMLILGGFIAIMLFAGYRALSGVLSVGIYSMMVYITQRLLWPLTSLGSTFDLYQRAMASVDRVMNLLDTREQLQDGDFSPKPQDVVPGFALADVSFSYRSGPPVLRDVSLEIPAGATVGIVGATGAGKTSLIRLLLRLHDVSSGAVLLGGRDIRDYRFSALRRITSLVSQDVYLFHGTAQENIRYGSPGASDEEVEAAAILAEADSFIRALPHGYETVVGERGQKLSGGQRQRISIARALLADTPILILDEATSSIDNETEAAIQRSIAHIARDKTLVVIAHRLSTIRYADQIHVLDQGRLVESGTHKELNAAGGVYSSLWAVQTGETVEV